MSIPLMCSSYCLVSLGKLEAEAEQEARRADRARETASELNRLIRDIYFLISTTRLKPSDLISGAQERRTRADAVEAKVERLRRMLAASDERAVLDRLSAKLKEARELIGKVEDALVSGNTGEILSSRAEIQKVAWELISPDLIALGEKLVAQTRNEPGDEQELRAKIRSLLWLSFAVSLFLSIILSVLVTRSVTRRLAQLARNSEIIAVGGKASWSAGGDDEIHQLETSLATMAENIRDNLARESALIDNSQDVICIVDADLKIRRVSPSVEEHLGISCEDVVGRNILQVIDERRHPQECDLIRSSIKARKNCEFEIEFSKESSVQGRSEPSLVGSSGKSTYAIAMSSLPESQTAFIFHDISRIRRAEQFKQEVLAMVSHDLRTPLATVGNTVTMLGEGIWGSIDGDKNHVIAEAQGACGEMASVISDLLFLDKVDSGTLHLQREEVNCGELVLSALRQIDEARLALVTTEGNIDDCPFFVECDRDRFVSYLGRLISSALLAAPGKPVIVRLNEDKASIEILDLGYEIPLNLQNDLFNRYKHADIDSYRPGCGLTLAAAAAYLTLDGWAIRYGRRQGQNSFLLTPDSVVRT